MIKLIYKLIAVLMLGTPLTLLAATGGAQITIASLGPVISLAIDGEYAGDPSVNIFSGSRNRRQCLSAQIAESESLQQSTSSMVGKEMDIYVGVISPSQRLDSVWNTL